jgi:hypothetical protein
MRYLVNTVEQLNAQQGQQDNERIILNSSNPYTLADIQFLRGRVRDPLTEFLDKRIV